MSTVYRKLNNSIIVYNPYVTKNDKVKIQVLDLNKKLIAEAYLDKGCFVENYRRLNSSIRLAVKQQCNLLIPSTWTYLNTYMEDKNDT